MKKDIDIKFKIQAEKLAQLTFLLARVCEEKEQYFTKLYKITNAEFRCMRFLHCDCYSSVKELAGVMRLTPGRITQIITALELKNLITREIDTSDRRNIKIKLTDSAIPYIKNVTEKHVQLHEKVLEQISENTRESVLTAMEELLNSLMNWSKQKE
ncbi:MAG: MarR family transcriptional regulator [Candidatus Kapabacteria bacterium]|nr:MarR family transcriptional regulator [Candidatus Kapabacteria bacterium]